jgi:hypothetical protein
MSHSRFLFLGIGAFAAIAGVFALVIQHDTAIKAMTEEQREAYKAEERQREARKTQQRGPKQQHPVLCKKHSARL